LKISDLVDRTAKPAPWSEGDNIPWHEPGFSGRMLKEHLSQEHDAASRRTATIERHVEWIHTSLLSPQLGSVLDLGCGPGLYSSRLARLGHRCTGIDYSPASIAYAREVAASENLLCRYELGDLRTADYGTGYGLAMLIYGELNVFRPQDARTILRKAHGALAEGGQLLLEPHTFATVQAIGEEGASWYSSQGGLFSDRPHLCLQESHWDGVTQTATVRYFVVDGRTGDVTRYAQSFQAYSDDELWSVLAECGFGEPRVYPSLAGELDGSEDSLITPGLFALVARRRPDED
jgi:SAM-dependent methyltransferase